MVDAYAFELLGSRRFAGRDFHETRVGVCRLTAPLTGVGIVSAKWANNALIYEGGSTGGYHTGTFTGYTCYTKSFTISYGQYVQVAAVWNSQTSGSNNWAKTDNLDADLDLTVTLPDGTKKYSWSSRNAWEYADFTADLGGTASAKVCVYRLDTGLQTWALAWIRSSAP